MLKTFFLFFLILGFGSYAQPTPEDEPFRLVPILSDLNRPWSVVFFPQGGGLVTLNGGQILLFDAQGNTQSISGVPTVNSAGQGGLLDIILDPDFSSNSLVYFTFAERREGGTGTSVGRGVLNRSQNRLEEVKVIFRGNNTAGGNNHFGSRLAFDSQGFLWVTIGEKNLRNTAQDPLNHGGTMVRITKEGESASGNPFDGTKGAKEVFSFGHRNSQGLAIHPQTGDIWMHEHGPRGGDEINLIKKGLNYGWPVITYGREYSGGQISGGRSEAPGMEQPIHHWTPSIAPSGMAWYFGEAFPQWQGDLFVGALAGRQLVRVRIEQKEGKVPQVVQEEAFLKNWSRIRDVRTDAQGQLYVLTDGPGAGLWRLEPK